MWPQSPSTEVQAMVAPFGGARWISSIALQIGLRGYRLEEPATARTATNHVPDGGQVLRCRAHRRWKDPPPVRTCLLCKLIAAKRNGGAKR
jgi:hypothetical protein